jgi:hypothetical protein
MEVILGISLYSYPYLKLPKCYVFLIAYFFSSPKLEKLAEQVLPGSKWVEGRGRGQGAGGERWPKQRMHK